MEKFDVIVIGSGPGGYVAAIKCAQLGLNTACVEMRTIKDKPKLGGTCLNVGCIPSKALLETSHKYIEAKEDFASEGIECKEVTFDLSKILARKDNIVNKLTMGVGGLFKFNKVKSIIGKGKLVFKNQVEVTHEGNSTLYEADNIILSSGSEPFELPFALFDSKDIISSTEALSLDKVPEKLGIIGAGVIGLELGSVWSRLGSQVTILEALPDFLAVADADIAKEAAKILKKQKLEILLNSKVKNAKVENSKVKVDYENDKGENLTLEFDKLIVAVGRKPNTQDLVADNLEIVIGAKGLIEVDDNCKTHLNNVYAIGDIVRGPMLAHKASEEGIMVAETIKGKYTEMNYNAIPNVIYTAPEIAWVGLTEKEVAQTNREYKVGTFPFAAIARAMTNNHTEGFVKTIVDKETDRILGIHIIGQNAGELIAQATTSLNFQASSEDIELTCFAHPTLAEALHESVLATNKHAIHMANK